MYARCGLPVAGESLHNAFKRVHHVTERCARFNLSVGDRSQHRLDCREVIEDSIPLSMALAKVARLATGDAFEDHVYRSTQEHDCVNARIELSLVCDAAGEEQHSLVVLIEQRVNQVLTPQVLPTVGGRHLLGVVADVRVDDAMPSAGKLRKGRRLPGPGIPVTITTATSPP